MTKKYDIIIIGGGNAGFAVSSIGSAAGKTIAFIESDEFGGTCPNRGCTPKKVLVAAAQCLHDIDAASSHCIEIGKPTLDWAKLIQRTKAMIAPIPQGMLGVADKRGDVYRGQGKFVGANSVAVNDQILEAENIVIATGSKTRPLTLPGAEHLITSDQVLSSEILPKEVVFIGGGVIAMEFSHVYARAGSKVTILEVMPRLLPRMEADAVTQVQGQSESLGIDIKVAVKVNKIEKIAERLRVHFEVDGVTTQLDTDVVVNGSGRIANVDNLDLAAANIKHDRIAIETDDYLRSVSNPAVWVCGDALVNSPQLSPIATYEGKIVGENIVNGASKKPNYDILPSCVYTIPTLSTVGLSEEQAKAQGLEVVVTTNDMSAWFSGKSYAETVAWIKVIVDPARDAIVGAHMVGHHGEDVIHLFAMAMRYNIPASKFKDDMFAYPTFSSDMKNVF